MLSYQQCIQLLMIALCAVFLPIVGTQRENQITKNLIVTGFLIFMQNVGYFMMLSAKSFGEALNAVRVEYLGTAYIVTFMTMFILQYCKRDLNRVVCMALLLYDTVELLAVWGCEHTSLYYTDIGFEIRRVPHFIHGNGPLYIVTAVLNIAQMLACIRIVFDTWKKAKPGKYRRSCFWMLCVVLFPLISYTLSIVDAFGVYDPVPSAAAITIFALGLIILFGRIFDGQSIAYANIIKKLKEPVILVDSEYHFMEANERAFEVFPSLQGLKDGDELSDPMLLFTLQNYRMSDIISDDYILRPDIQKIIENGKVRGYAVLFSDLTEERRQLERSHQLKLEAELANKAKSEFLAQMSHEIRTPINAVLGMNEMILRESGEEQIKRYAADIKSSASSLLSIINEILDLAKVEAGKMQLIPVEYNISSLFGDLYNMMNVRAKEKELALTFDIQKDIPCAYFGDDIRLRQILTNLLTNAIKYTREGAVTLSVRGGAKGDIAYLRFAVQDTGIGIREEDINKLFQKFQRFDEEKNRSVEGTGLGMNITMRLLALMESELQVESTYGRGSCFYFDLHQPIVNKEPLGDFSERLKEQAAGYQWKTRYTAPQAQVLVVDDNRVNRKVFMNLLKDTGMHIDEADGGKRALHMVEEKHYDLIFLDHMMPEMDGIETLHEMKKLDLKASANDVTPVIMLTANAVVGAAENYIKEGFTDFLSKPIIPEKLDAMVCKHLPEELLKYGSPAKKAPVASADVPPVKKVQKISVSLPPVEEFDWEAAMRIVEDETLLKETLQDFVAMLPQTGQELERYMKTIDQEESLYDYCICVHSLKSSAATVGAGLLAMLARLLEAAAGQKNMQRIDQLHPVLLEELDRHYARLRAVFPEDKAQLIKSDRELPEYLGMLRDDLSRRDLNASDRIVRELVRYTRGGAHTADFAELKKQVDNLDFAQAAVTAQELLERLSRGGEV